MRLFSLTLCLLCLVACKQEEKSSPAIAVNDIEKVEKTSMIRDPTDLDELELHADPENYNIVPVVKDLSNPWGMDWTPSGDLIYTEKEGKMFRFDGDQSYEIKNVPKVYVRGQGGLLDVITHPDFESNNYIYLSYASEQGEGKGGNTAIARAKLINDELQQLEVLYKASPNTKKGQHFGSRFAWGDDGKLYFSIGERGARDVNPQDLSRDGGKIYRLNDNGSIPSDNPFVDTENALPAIYTYGNRNPQGLLRHPKTGQIIAHEHGPKGGDEINIIKAGTNYGWPVISYGVNYSGTKFTDKVKQEGMAQPMAYWDPSIAPSGFAVIDSDNYTDWNGNYLVGSLKFSYVEMLEADGDKIVKRTKLADGFGRMRNVKIGPDGLIYLGVEGDGIYRLEPK